MVKDSKSMSTETIPGLENCDIIVITCSGSVSDSYKRKTTVGKFEVICGALISLQKGEGIPTSFDHQHTHIKTIG